MKQADVSISLQGASTIATDTADIILMNGELKYIDQLFNIANNLNHIMKKSTIMVVMPAAMILLGSVLPRSLYHCSSLMKQDTLKGK
jgi:Cu2+-exporting ATPase